MPATRLVTELPQLMKAAVFKGPHNIVVEQRAVPKILDPRDAIIKVRAAGLCGTELHTYRGKVQFSRPNSNHTMGHEFIGDVVAVGSAVENFKIGDDVLSTFTIQCGECWFCKHGYTSKCPHSYPFGTAELDGGQAEYCRIPYADHTLFPKPDITGIEDSTMLLMSDIFTTGYFGIKNILKFFKGTLKPEEMTILQLGCGPVGLCAITSAKELGVKTLYAVDNVPERMEMAKEFGADKVLNFETDDLAKELDAVTEGRGPDAVLEVVGSEQALDTSFRVVRRSGFISSIGYQHGKIPFNGLECYLKNVTIEFGRCPAQALYPESLEIFKKVAPKFEGFIDCTLPLEEAAKGYEMFDKHQVRKVCFIP